MELLQVDEKHQKEMDALARIATCEKCGHVGLWKNSKITQKTKDGTKEVLRYKCPKCLTSYNEVRLADLLNGQPTPLKTSESVTTEKQEPKAKAPGVRPGTTPVKPDKIEPFLLELFEDIKSIYKQPGGELPIQQILQVVKDYQTATPEPDVRLHCPGCGKPMQKTGKSPIRWRCNTKGCEFYTSRKTQEGWEKIIKEKGASK